MSLHVLRTPDARFADLPDWPYPPHYLEHGGLRMAYIDEGPRDAAETVLALHGEPTWGYLYRQFVPVLAREHRFVAPDMIGFGRSDKLPRTGDHSFGLHLRWYERFVESLGLDGVTLVVQDWGGLLGLSLLARHPECFRRVVILNTFLPVGRPLPLGFRAWQAFARWCPGVWTSALVRYATARPLSRAVAAAYAAPFPDASYMAGPRAMPQLVPGAPDDEGVVEMRHAREVLGRWTKPAFVLWAEGDPVLGRRQGFFTELIPSVRDEPRHVVARASHFLQEDAGVEIAGRVAEFMREGSESGFTGFED